MNKKKQWGILVPLNIEKILYPKEKIEYESGYILATILRRISVIITYYILFPLRIGPNVITIFSIFLIFLSSFFFINSKFFAGSFILILWVLFDGIDGELSRILKNITKVGGVLEKINSDLLYVFFLPSLSIGLYKSEIISFNYLYFCFFSIVTFNLLRVYVSTFPGNSERGLKKKLIIFLACQFKNSVALRKRNPLFSFIFYLWRNIFTQCGITELVLVFISSPYFFNPTLFEYFILFFIVGYSILNILILLGIIFYNKLIK